MAGYLYGVGIGPGAYEKMTIEAARVLEECDVITGYTVYVDLIKDHFKEKEFFTTPLRQEVERCRTALEEAAKGRRVAMVCSGDPGVYGMAGLILELSPQYPEVKIQVISGVTAACGGGAALGAPLIHDFAVISLSDLLTPMEVIEKRVQAAAEGDFVLCIYNPASKKRAGYLKRACEIVLKYRSPQTVCGTVKNIGRQGEEMAVMSLEALKDIQADMFTTVFIGNSSTKKIGEYMVTPRGYRHG